MIKKVINSLHVMMLKLRYGGRIELDSIPATHLLPRIRVNGSGKIRIGAGFMAEKNSSLEVYSEGIITIGENVFINSNVKIVSRESIIIGNNTVIAPNVCIYDHDHNWRGGEMQTEYLQNEVIIGNEVWIGANSVILRGTTIGDGSVIAAGSIIKGDYPSEVMVYQTKVDRIIKK